MTRRDIEFDADGTTLRGWFYPAQHAGGSAPVIVMAHGLSGVKEMFLDDYAAAFSDAGLSALVFDNRNFGASDGEPRQEIDPVAQVRDYRHAITYARTLPEVDLSRVGIWGSSYSGGHVLTVGAFDRRVKAVVSQVPMVDGYENTRSMVRADFVGGFREQFDADRDARFRGEAPAMIPAVSEDPLGPAAMPTPDAYRWFIRTHEDRAPAWRNEVTLRSVELLSEYSPDSIVERISPTPLLVLVAENDVLAPTELALATYQKAREPKKLVLLPGGHFDAYVTAFDASMVPARDWFLEHLRP